MRHIEIPSTLYKAGSSGEWRVGGVASGYWRDLDGEAVTPDAVREAIPGFMACRGNNGIKGGPIHLHHNFWSSFLQQAIRSLGLSNEEQMELIAGISLPLGRVTEIWVDSDGTTHWRGVLSQANPISRVIWRLLQEKLIALGVSLGGKILSTSCGVDKLGQPCRLITRIRLDELSVTANPALRLTGCEDPSNGAYITALSKAISSTLRNPMTTAIDRFLRKALTPKQARYSSPAVQNWGSASDFNSGDTAVRTHSDRPPLSAAPQKPAKRGSHRGQNIPDTVTGIGGKVPEVNWPRGTKSITTDVWGLSVPQLVKRLKKCAELDKEAFSSPEVLSLFQGGAGALSTLTPNPPIELINLVRLLQQISMFSQNLPRMSPWQAEGTLIEMKKSLRKGLMAFEAAVPKELLAKPFRPPGSPPVATMQIPFPDQYRQY